MLSDSNGVIPLAMAHCLMEALTEMGAAECRVMQERPILMAALDFESASWADLIERESAGVMTAMARIAALLHSHRLAGRFVREQPAAARQGIRSKSRC